MINRNIYSGIVSLLVMFLTTANAFPEEGSGHKDIYEKVKTKYREMTSFISTIECDITISGTSSYNMKGMIATTPPAKWSIYLASNQEGGKSKLMLLDIFNGKTQWTYNTRNARVESRDVKPDSGNRENSRKFFPAFELYREDTISLIKETDQLLILQLASKKPSSLFHYVRLHINKHTLLVEMMEFLDSRKKVRISVAFSGIDTSGKPDDRVFEPSKKDMNDANRIVSRLKKLTRQEN